MGRKRAMERMISKQSAIGDQIQLNSLSNLSKVIVDGGSAENILDSMNGNQSPQNLLATVDDEKEAGVQVKENEDEELHSEYKQGTKEMIKTIKMHQKSNEIAYDLNEQEGDEDNDDVSRLV